MHYILSGFVHETGFRVFTFECVGEERQRTEFKVKADLALIRRYGIRIQDLPLLCREMLERRVSDEPRTLTYTEADMCVNAAASAARAAERKKAPRKPPPSENVGAAWRGVRV